MFSAVFDRTRSRHNRRGTTLLELLVVITVILSVTAISIPVIAPAVKGRRVREGARMFSTFLNAARNRAIETGRSAGVWIDRLPGYPEACSAISMAEIPPAYGGDFLDSSVQGIIINKNGTCDGVPYGSTDATIGRDYWNVIVPRTRTTFLTDIWANPDPAEQTIVREGDLIKIEGSDYLYKLRVVETNIDGNAGAGGSRKWWYISRGRNSGGGAEGAYSNAIDVDGRYNIGWWDGLVGTGSCIRNAYKLFDRNATGLRYQIYRQPSKMQAGGIQLPEGIVLDLNFSGMSNGTVGASSIVNNNIESNQTGGTPFHPHQVTPAGSDATYNPYWGPPIYPDDRTPVIIVFNSGGQVDRVYSQCRGASRANFMWQGQFPYGPIYFLVGKLDRIFPDEYYLTSTPAAESLAIQQKKNWQDLENLWVTIDPLNGLITTSRIDDIADTANDYTFLADPQNVRWSRLSASRTRQSVGGK